MSDRLVTDEQLPAQPATGASFSERDYYRRRIDELGDRRLIGIESAVVDLEKRVDELVGRFDGIDRKIAFLAGALAVATFLANLIGPPLVRAVFGA